ncbi:MAG: Rho termination factor N-terminal domain-containing protein [Rhodobacteraceae bacterium]|nr:Rho termination factor N-terminal domain-containing protein [Paracoccaceae bacterium]
MANAAKRTDPVLWDEVKEEITRGARGGRPGQWSARKAQMAVQEYKRRGGGYEEDGLAQDETDLHRWTGEDWGTRSGAESGLTGERYLPRSIRMLLTEDEYRRSTRAKRRGTAQAAAQPEDVRAKIARLRASGPTRVILMERAADLGIAGRDRMDKAALLQAIEDATDANGHPKAAGPALRALPFKALRQIARDRGIAGRSRMTKAELVRALS